MSGLLTSGGLTAVVNSISLALVLCGVALAFRLGRRPQTAWWTFALGCLVHIRLWGLVFPFGAIVVLVMLGWRSRASWRE